jgi:hypothetical protein
VLALSRAAALLLLGALAIAPGAGCGSPDLPPALGDPASGADGGAGEGDGSAGGPIVGDSALQAPSCTVGVAGGVCDCTDEPLLTDLPTLYFVLDRSGSMSDYATPSNPGGKWGTVQQVLLQLAVGLGPRAKFAFAVFPNPQLDGCAPGEEVFQPIQGDAPPGVEGPNERIWFAQLQAIAANGGTPTAATLQGLTSRLRSLSLSGKVYVIFATDGGPNCDANAVCDASMCTLNIESTSGCTPTGPDCCTGQGNGLSCLDAQPSVDAVKAIAQAGVPVYVLGIPESEPYANLLDQLAVAGGTARGSEPQYYAISSTDEASFYSALSQVAAQITGTCTLTLSSVPPDPALVNVFFNGSAIAQSGPDGWALDGATVTLLGASCQQVLSGAVLDVRVVAGCPTVTQ